MDRNEFGITKDQSEKYMERRKIEIIEMEVSLRNKDLATIQNFGHKLKGNAEPFGHKQLGILGAEIEESSKENSLEKTQAIFEKIKKYINKN